MVRVKANPDIIKMWAQRDRCWMCKHRFKKPVILPVHKPECGKLQPHYNAEIFWHLWDTHGIPDEIAIGWVFGSVYGLELTEVGAITS